MPASIPSRIRNDAGAGTTARHRGQWSAIAALATVAVVGGLLLTGAAGASSGGDPGAIVRWGLPIVTTMALLAGAVTIGALLLAVGVLPRDPPGHRGHPHARHGAGAGAGSGSGAAKDPPAPRPAWRQAVSIASVAAGVWTFALLIQTVLTYADTAGRPLGSAGFAEELRLFMTQVSLGRALSATTILAAITCLAAVATSRYIGAIWTAVAALAVLVPVASTGHPAGSSGHTVAMSAAWMHSAAISIWVGGLIALVLIWPVVRREAAAADGGAVGPGGAGAGRSERLTVMVARRFARMATWCYLLVAISGIADATIRLTSPEQLLSTSYGRLLSIKVGCFIALGIIGVIVRRRLVAPADGARTDFGAQPATSDAVASPAARGDRTLLWRLATVELVILTIAMGLAAALAATPAPVPVTVSDSLVEALTGYRLPPPPTFANWILLWHPDVLFGTACVIGVVMYLRWVIRLARRGDSWPGWRTASWLLGMIAMFWVTNGGPVVYGHLLFSAHMVLHMTVAMVIPVLLVLAAPVTLLMRAVPVRTDGSRGPREWMLAMVHSGWARFFAHPLVAGFNFVGSMILFYYTGLFDLAMSTHAGHIVMLVHFTLAGYMFANILIGIDPGPNRPPYPVRLLLLFCTMAFHAFFGIAIISQTTLLAADWFNQIGTVYGIDRLADQGEGGAITWGIGEIPTLMLAIALAVAWARDDERTARRRDRAADRDGDAELAAYNAMLARMAEQEE